MWVNDIVGTLVKVKPWRGEETPETAVKYDHLEGDYSHVPPTPKWSARPMNYSIQFPQSNNEAFNYWELELQRRGTRVLFHPHPPPPPQTSTPKAALPSQTHLEVRDMKHQRLPPTPWPISTHSVTVDREEMVHNHNWNHFSLSVYLSGWGAVDILISVSGGSFSERCRTWQVPCIFIGCWPIKVVVTDL